MTLKQTNYFYYVSYDFFIRNRSGVTTHSGSGDATEVTVTGHGGLSNLRMIEDLKSRLGAGIKAPENCTVDITFKLIFLLRVE